MPLVVVAHVSSAAGAAIAERLASRGVEPWIVDRPSALALFFAAGTYRVRIAVEQHDLEAARAILEEWKVEAVPRVRALARSQLRDFALALLPPLVVGAILWRFVRVAWYPLILLGIWVASVLAIALWRRLRAPDHSSGASG